MVNTQTMTGTQYRQQSCQYLSGTAISSNMLHGAGVGLAPLVTVMLMMSPLLICTVLELPGVGELHSPTDGPVSLYGVLSNFWKPLTAIFRCLAITALPGSSHTLTNPVLLGSMLDAHFMV